MSGGGEQMPKVDMSKEFSKLNLTDQHYVKRLEGLNSVRATASRSLKSRNKLTAALVGSGVLGIYIYTIFSVKQETFLDDLDTSQTKKLNK